MIKRILFLILVIFIISCTTNNTPDTNYPKSTECIKDADCITGGCSGTICQSKDSEPMITTCEWTEKYACYKLTSCGCIDGKCAWRETDEFNECIEKSSSGVIS